MMRHWHEVLPAGTVLDLRYEDMVANTEGQARRLLDYLGLPWDDRCLNFSSKQAHRSHCQCGAIAQADLPNIAGALGALPAGHLGPLLELVKDEQDIYVRSK